MCKSQSFHWLRWGCVLLAVGAALLWTGQAQAAPPAPGSPIVYWVNDPGDAADANPGDGICDVTPLVTPLPSRAGTSPGPGINAEPCTLRAAIEEANLDGFPSVIVFEVCWNDGPWSGSGGQMLPTGEVIIQPGVFGAPLPAMTDNLTYINGYTQGYFSPTPGYDDPAIVPGSCFAPLIAMPNTTSFGTPMNTVLAVEVEGSLCVPPVPAPGSTITLVPGGFVPSGSILPWAGVGACSGFTVLGSQNVIAGLNIHTWANAGILIMPSPVEPDIPVQNVVWGNFIGTNITGTVAGPGNRFGVEIVGGVQQTYIGETWYIPTWGVSDESWGEELTNNERNLISGNDNHAHLYGNLCALDASGSGLTFYEDGAGVFIGYDPCIRTGAGASPAESEILTGGGLENQVRNNYIGTDFEGIAPVPNSNGVWLNYEAPANHIGGCVKFPFTPGDPPPCQPHHTLDLEQDANLISGNRRYSEGGFYAGGHGVWLNGTPLPHLIKASGVITNEIGGNFIGTDATGMEGVPNSGNGVYLRAGFDFGAPMNNEVGATAEFIDLDNAYQYGNLISGNGDINNAMFEDLLPPGYPFGPFNNGVELLGMGVVWNRIGYGNVIGLDSQLVGPLGNGDNGVLIWLMASENYVHNNAGLNLSKPFIAGDPPSDAGAIGANGAFQTAPGRSGVKIEEQASFNAVFRNCIGGDGALCAEPVAGAPLGNAAHGVFITSTATMNTVGLNPTGGITDTAIAEENWIHRNGVSGAGDGVAVVGENSDQNTIRFNAIWLNGNPAVGNLGIDLGDDGDTANDVGDPDGGPNEEMNYPDAVVDAAHWIVRFRACAGCTVDLYATLQSQSDWGVNRGEGRHWLTSTLVSSHSVSNTLNIAADITRTLGSPPAENVCITLTATDVNGNTSEFSDCVDARFDPNRVDLSGLTPQGWLALVPAMLGVFAVALLLRRHRTSTG